MTNHIFNYTTLFLLIFFLTGCKSEAPVKTSEANVYFRYLETTKQIHAEVSFFEQKNPPIPKKWDNVHFVNILMKGLQIKPKQFRYSVDLDQQEFSNKFPIKFWNKGDLPREIILEPTQVINFSLKNTTSDSPEILNRNTEAVLSFKASGFSGKEKITLLFTNEKNESASFVVNQPVADGKVSLSAKNLEKIPSGKVKAEMIITKTTLSENKDAKANIVCEFYSKAIELLVE